MNKDNSRAYASSQDYRKGQLLHRRLSHYLAWLSSRPREMRTSHVHRSVVINPCPTFCGLGWAVSIWNGAQRNRMRQNGLMSMQGRLNAVTFCHLQVHRNGHDIVLFGRERTCTKTKCRIHIEHLRLVTDGSFQTQSFCCFRPSSLFWSYSQFWGFDAIESVAEPRGHLQYPEGDRSTCRWIVVPFGVAYRRHPQLGTSPQDA